MGAPPGPVCAICGNAILVDITKLLGDIAVGDASSVSKVDNNDLSNIA